VGTVATIRTWRLLDRIAGGEALGFPFPFDLVCTNVAIDLFFIVDEAFAATKGRELATAAVMKFIVKGRKNLWSLIFRNFQPTDL